MNDDASSVKYIVDEQTRLVGFGWIDLRGREVGLQVRASTYAACLGPRAHESYEHRGRVYDDTFSDATRTYYPAGRTLERAPGLYYAAWCQATRGGETFGATQGERVFDSAEERDAYIEQRLAGARERAPRASRSGRRPR